MLIAEFGISSKFGVKIEWTMLFSSSDTDCVMVGTTQSLISYLSLKGNAYVIS